MPSLKPLVPVFVGLGFLLVGQVAMTLLASNGVVRLPTFAFSSGVPSHPAPSAPGMPAERPEPSPKAEEVAAAVRSWAAAQTASDMASYSAMYAPDFVGIKRTRDGTSHPYPSLDAWLEKKESAFEGGHEVHVRWITPEFSSDGRAATVRFVQYWRNRKGYADYGSKQLDLRRDAAGWRITREEMLTSASWVFPSPPDDGYFDLPTGEYGADSFEWGLARDQTAAWCARSGQCGQEVVGALGDESCKGNLVADPEGLSAEFSTGCGAALALEWTARGWKPRAFEGTAASSAAVPAAAATHEVWGTAGDAEPWLNLRAGPNKAVLGQLPDGTALRMLRDHGDWVEVRVLDGDNADVEGFAFSRFVRPVGPERVPKPSFDCAKAGTPVEKLLCADADLADLDREMAGLYGDLRGSLSGTAKKALRDEQISWIRERGRCKDQPDMAGCVRGLFVRRIDELR
jgi:hypothetical protein